MNIAQQIDIAISWLVRDRDVVCQRCGEERFYKLGSHHILFKSHGDAGRHDPAHSILLCDKCHQRNPDAPHVDNTKFWAWLEDYLIHRAEKKRLTELRVLRYSPIVTIRLLEKQEILKKLRAEKDEIEKTKWMDPV